jgi:excisionase family DNA binding protein
MARARQRVGGARHRDPQRGGGKVAAPMTLEQALAELVKALREEIAAAAKQPANDTTEFMTVAEAAQHARVSAATVRRWVRVGELTKHKAGTRVIVRRDELEKFLTCEIIPIDAHLSLEEQARRRFG